MTKLSRRHVLTYGAATAAVVALADPAHAALPVVDMEMVLLAAQVDPPKPDTGLTPGASGHVITVERALNAKGLLASGSVDGHYGTSTVSAYAAWQRSLGYTGIDANGVPGPTSLTRLGEGRFTVTRTVSTGSRTDAYSGKRVNTRTRNMLAAADVMLTWSITLS